MADSNPKTIILRAQSDHMVKEKVAAEAVTPGHLIEGNSADKYQKHSTAGGAARKLFAMEASEWGKTIDDAYAADDTLRAFGAQSEDEVYAWLKAGAAVDINDAMQSAGNGELEGLGGVASPSPGVVGTDQEIVAWALEAKDNTAGTAAVRIKVAVA
jgi:hypothetical protein